MRFDPLGIGIVAKQWSVCGRVSEIKAFSGHPAPAVQKPKEGPASDREIAKVSMQ